MMNDAPSGSKEQWIGTIFALLSTCFYALANVILRYLADCKVDLEWLLLYKESIGLAVLIPWLLFRWYQGRLLYISKRLIPYILLAAFICELIGSHLQLLGNAVIGLIIAVPLIQSATLIGVACLGYWILGDPLSKRRQLAIVILLTAVTVLSVGKMFANGGVIPPALGQPLSLPMTIAVAAGTVCAGFSFSVYIIILRYVIRRYWKDETNPWRSFSFRHWIGHDFVMQPGVKVYSPFPVTLMMALVFAVGIAIFASCLYVKSGIAGFYTVPSIAWYLIPVSGITNVIGFFFQIQGLRMTTAVQASLIAVSQMILLSIIGYLFFAEAINALVIFGLVLTGYGVMMSAKPER